MSGPGRDPAASILASGKYSALHPPLVRRVVEECRSRTPGDRAAEQMARRRLHQLYAAFVDPRTIRAFEGLVGDLEAGFLPVSPLDPRHRAACLGVLAHHASTAERASHLPELWAQLRRFLGTGKVRLLDLGCGLNPLTLGWMELEPGSVYQAVDVDTRMTALIRRYVALAGVAGEAVCADLVTEPPPAGPWDGVLLLKLLPTLERQAAGVSERLVGALETGRLVVSYARASLGGRRKGMDESYARDHDRLCQACGLECERLVFPGETVFLCLRRPEGHGIPATP